MALIEELENEARGEVQADIDQRVRELVVSRIDAKVQSLEDRVRDLQSNLDGATAERDQAVADREAYLATVG